MINLVEIENFRSIKSLSFAPGSLNALIGPNNSGKSNILRAISLLLGPKWPSSAFSEEDKHHDLPGDQTRIEVRFASPLIHYYYSTPVAVHGLRLDHQPGNAPEFYCLDASGNEIRMGKANNLFRPSREFRDQIPSLHVDVRRDLESELNASQWTLLGKMLAELERRMLQDPAFAGGFTTKAADLTQHLRGAEITAFERMLNEEMSGMSGFRALAIEFGTPELLGCLKALEVKIKEDSVSSWSNAGELGEGLQSALVIAFSRVYQRLMSPTIAPVLLLEEPEVFLHPQARNAFYSLLRQTADAGTCQIFYTTHSSEFINVTEPEEIVLVRKTPAGGTDIKQGISGVLLPDQKAALKIECEVDARLKSLFFATAVVACEGETEAVSFPTILRSCGVDIDRVGVTVLSSGSKDNLPFLIGLTSHFGIPTIAVFDDDSDKVDFSTKHDALNKKIIALAGGIGNCEVSPMDFEKAHGVPAGGSKQRAALAWAQALTPSQALVHGGSLVSKLTALGLIAVSSPPTSAGAPNPSPVPITANPGVSPPASPAPLPTPPNAGGGPSPDSDRNPSRL